MLELITDKYYGGIIVEEYGISLENGIPAGAENMLSAGGILLLSAFIVLTIVVIKRWNGRFVNVLAGAFAYSIFVFICCNLIMSALALIPSIDEAFTNNSTAYTSCIFNSCGCCNDICKICIVQVYEWEI